VKKRKDGRGMELTAGRTTKRNNKSIGGFGQEIMYKRDRQINSVSDGTVLMLRIAMKRVNKMDR